MKVGNKSLVVRKAKILESNFLELEYAYNEFVLNDDLAVEYSPVTEYKTKGSRYIHDDLKNAFRLLGPHLALLCELIKEDESVEEAFEDGTIYDREDFGKFVVTGFVISGEDEGQGVVLIGRKQLRNKRVLNLITPFIKMDQSNEEEPYKFDYYLSVSVGRCVEQIRQYLEESKCSLSPQLSMFQNS